MGTSNLVISVFAVLAAASLFIFIVLGWIVMTMVPAKIKNERL